VAHHHAVAGHARDAHRQGHGQRDGEPLWNRRHRQGDGTEQNLLEWLFPGQADHHQQGGEHECNRAEAPRETLHAP
jgi:hypothetical protein